MLERSREAQDKRKATLFMEPEKAQQICPLCGDTLILRGSEIRCLEADCQLKLKIEGGAAAVDLEDFVNKVFFLCVSEHQEEEQQSECGGDRRLLHFAAHADPRKFMPQVQDWTISCQCVYCGFEKFFGLASQIS